MSWWLLDLTAMALAENLTLSSYTGFVQGFGRRALDHQGRDFVACFGSFEFLSVLCFEFHFQGEIL
jgi:hypothetical protein